jgi:CheY-like chemotaxis protein
VANKIEIPRDVLLVEDEALIALNTEDMLREIGVATVRVAATVPLALAAIEQALPNFALLDVYLRSQSAIEVAYRLSADGVPFAFASGIGEAANLPAKFRHLRMLAKPYTIDQLRTALVDY